MTAALALDVPAAPMTVLLVDDDPGILKLVGGVLQSAGFRVREAATGAAAVESLRTSRFDAVLLDLQLPDANGLDICREMRATPALRLLPVLFLTGSTDSDTVDAAFDAGGTEFITKPVHVPTLVHRVSQAIHLRETLSTLERERERLESAEHIARLGSWEWEARTDRVRGSRECWRIMGLRPCNEVAMADFLVAFEEDDRLRVEHGLRWSYKGVKPFRHRGTLPSPRGGISLTIEFLGEPLLDATGVCIGLRGSVQDLTQTLAAGPTPHGKRPAAPLARADPRPAELRDATMAARFQRALGSGRVRMVYQPQVDMRNGGTHQVEALMRWHDQVLGEVAPAQFIAAAEKNGLAAQTFAFSLNEACREVTRLNRLLRRQLAVAVNLTVAALEDPDLTAAIDGALEEWGLPPSQLELEITEGVLAGDLARASPALANLHARGVRLSLDDFGVGFSSLAHLRHFPVGTIKIDRSFVAKLPENAQDRAIVGAMINMCGRLGLDVVAEGVETVAQRDVLLDLGCYMAQGYLFSPPLGAEELTARLAARSGALVP